MSALIAGLTCIPVGAVVEIQSKIVVDSDGDLHARGEDGSCLRCSHMVHRIDNRQFFIADLVTIATDEVRVLIFGRYSIPCTVGVIKDIYSYSEGEPPDAILPLIEEVKHRFLPMKRGDTEIG